MTNPGPNPFNFPLPPPGETAGIPLETFYQMNEADDSCEVLEAQTAMGNTLSGGLVFKEAAENTSNAPTDDDVADY